MSDDLTSNVLKKLSKKTGREWNVEDIFRLAEKLTEMSDESLADVLSELETMGLEIPKKTKSKLRRKRKDDPAIPVEEINKMERQLEEVVKKTEKKTASKAKKRPVATAKPKTAAVLKKSTKGKR
ncbi:hypothetical protein ACI7RC_19850 [Brevibacillus sp. B_LB10_24]